MIEEDANQFKEGLTLTFQTLHEAIATRDTATISAICEGNLRTAINDFFDALDEEECEIQERQVLEPDFIEDDDTDDDENQDRNSAIEL